MVIYVFRDFCPKKICANSLGPVGGDDVRLPDVTAFLVKKNT